METASTQLTTILRGLNQIQRAAIPFDRIMLLAVELEAAVGSLDVRVFESFTRLDLSGMPVRESTGKRQKSRHTRTTTHHTHPQIPTHT